MHVRHRIFIQIQIIHSVKDAITHAKLVAVILLQVVVVVRQTQVDL